MQGLSPAAEAARAAALAKLRELYQLDLSQRELAAELGVSEPTVCKYLKELRERGDLKKRPRGAITSLRMSDYWQSEEGRRERAKRSEAMRSEPPVEKVCEHCSEPFELSATRAAREPGLYCSSECVVAARVASIGLEPLRDGRKQWRGDVAKLKAEHPDWLDVDGVVKALPRELRRSPGGVRGHVRSGVLIPEPNELGLWLFTPTAVDHYIAWLREHPDWRLNRFNATSEAAARWRAAWYERRHKSAAEWGRVSALISKSGPKKKYSDEEAKNVRELRAQGLSYGQIEVRAGLSKKQVRGILAP